MWLDYQKVSPSGDRAFNARCSEEMRKEWWLFQVTANSDSELRKALDSEILAKCKDDIKSDLNLINVNGVFAFQQGGWTLLANNRHEGFGIIGVNEPNGPKWGFYPSEADNTACFMYAGCRWSKLSE